MTAFATPTDLASYLQRTFSTAETATATLLLDLASDVIRSYTRQTLTRVTDDQVQLRGTNSRILVLPERPVVSVSAVTLATFTVSSAAYLLVRDELWWGASALNVGNLPEAGTGWGTPGSIVTVTYTHGFATVPNDIRAVCLSVATRLFTNPQGLIREQINMGPASTNVMYARNIVGELTDGEKEVLRRYRKTAVALAL